MTDSKKSPQNTSRQDPEKDRFLTVLYAPDRKSFARLLREEMLDVGPIHARPDSDEIEVHLYADEDQIEKLREAGWQLDVRANLSEAGRKRQEEVGKGDRFEGGTIPPEGLGKKMGEED